MAENDQKQLSSDNQLPPADLLQLILGGNIDQLQDQFQLNLQQPMQVQVQPQVVQLPHAQPMIQSPIRRPQVVQSPMVPASPALCAPPPDKSPQPICPQEQKPPEEEKESEKDICEGLIDDESFHGIIPMEDLRELLKHNGDYLLRGTNARDEGRRIVISVFWMGQVKTFDIKSKNNRVTFDFVNMKTTIVELITFHRLSQIPISPDGVVITKAITRQSWELRREHISLGVKVGDGAFGEVYKGTLKLKTGASVEVAVKIPKTKELKKDMVGEAMKEAKIQKEYIHPNVVRLYGVSAETDPLMIVLEFVSGGSLDIYLKRMKGKLTADNKATMCFDVSCGLNYLHSLNCIHRDIAARNCLMEIKYGLVKIADFGLSSIGNVQIMDKTKPAPIRWLAPEVLKTAAYMKPSDIWSLAIVYWEIYTDCAEMPYQNLSLNEIQRRLCTETDFHPTMPENCDPEVSKLALSCWNVDPQQRPVAGRCTMTLIRFTNKDRYTKIPGFDQRFLAAMAQNVELLKKRSKKQHKRKKQTPPKTKPHSKASISAPKVLKSNRSSKSTPIPKEEAGSLQRNKGKSRIHRKPDTPSDGKGPKDSTIKSVKKKEGSSGSSKKKQLA